MKKPRFVQILAGATPGDASSEEARAVARKAETTHHFGAVETYAAHRAPGLEFPVRELRKFVPRPTDRILVHYGTRIPGLEACTAGASYGLLYHNITPAHFFRPYSLFVAAELELARRALPRTAVGARLNIAHSHFSARELISAGAPNILVLPLAVHAQAIVARGHWNTDIRKREAVRRDAGPVLLFVGRTAPNKGHVDLVKALYFLKHWYPEARLVLAGRPVLRAPGYGQEVVRVTRSLGLEADVEMTGELDETGLVDAYRKADVFVVASLHEGFCLPVLEAMAFGLPVVASAAGDSAVAETMGQAGLRVEEGGHVALAAAVARVFRDADLRRALVDGQREWVGALLRRDPAGQILEALEAGFHGDAWKTG